MSAPARPGDADGADRAGRDLAALRQLVDAYADAVDRRDGARLQALFAPDAEVRVQADGGGPVESSWRGPGLGGLLDTLLPYQRTFHHVGGAVFEIDASGREARGWTHCIAHHYERSRGGPTDLVMMIRYQDRFGRDTEGGWRIADRQVIIDWTELHPAHPLRRPQPRRDPPSG